MTPEKKSERAAATDAWRAFRYRDFTVLQASRVLNIVAFQMMSVALAQDVYTHTHSAMSLGLVGLFQFFPSIAFALFTGHAADRYPRRVVVQWCQVLMMVCMVLILGLAWQGFTRMWLLYAVLFVVGTARAFQAPAASALMPQLIPKEVFSNAVTWNGSIFNISTIAGPSAGGLLYGLAHSSVPVYLLSAAMMGGAIVFMAMITKIPAAKDGADFGWDSLLAGIKFVFNRKVVLGATTLDLFAVLLGGAVALLPIYANEYLRLNGKPVGELGLGFLRASFAIGAVVMGFVMAHLPTLKRAGHTMFAAVGAFGVFTILFGIAHNFWWALFCLFMLGAVDMVSVIIRNTMVQLTTPDEMRGRVSAVNMIFIGASNELGEFESGTTAAWFGTVRAVVLGGIGTLVVTGLWAWWFPELREFRRLDSSTDTPGKGAELAKEIEDEREETIAI